MSVLQFPTQDIDVEPGTYTSVELLARSGITYRQLDYWTRTGLLNPRPRRRDDSGYPRVFTADQVAFACLLKQLLDGGMALRAAGEHAHRLIETGTTTIAGLLVHLPEEL